MMKNAPLAVLTLAAVVLTSCTTPSTSETANTDVESATYYDDVETRAKFDPSSETSFYDDMSDGLDDDVWYAIDGLWHDSTYQNGVQKKNLFYLQDGNDKYLGLRGTGVYNQTATYVGKSEGACILSKEHLSPGRYEIEMMAMPHEGGVTAFWTYCTRTGNESTSQNEIDVEIGGTTNGSQFESIWATSWTTKTSKATNAIDVTEQLYLNDGVFHKYSFDWYTNYPGSGARRVDWFIDGVFITSIEGDGLVPEYDTPLWVGLWFPPLWAGNATFVEDYMIVRNVSFTAFGSKQYYEECSAEASYNKYVPSTIGMKTIAYSSAKNVQKFSNVDFESLSQATYDNSYYGWKVLDASKGSVALASDKTQGSYSYKLTAGTPSEGYYGEYLVQSLTNSYPGYQFDFSIDAKLENSSSSGQVTISYYTRTDRFLSSVTLPVISTSWGSLSSKLTVPNTGFKIEIELASESGGVLFDNASFARTK